MSDLSSIEKLKFEKLFGMNSGYVIDFSNRTFEQFVLEHTGVEIYDEKYNYGSGSKANRLRAFWDKEPNFLVAKFLEQLLNYWASTNKINRLVPESNPKAEYYDACLKILERLKKDSPIENIDVIMPNSDDETFSLLAKSIRESIENNEPAGALDRLHTFVVKHIRELSEKHSISYDKKVPLHSLFGGYVKFLKENNLIESEMTERILKSSISVLEAFNGVRNNQSFAHDNPILNDNESVLIFNNISNTIRFINAIEKKIADQCARGDDREVEWTDIPFSDEEVEAAGDEWIQMEVDRIRGK
ncbi:MAG: hypothetical protein A3E37_02795 [Candidatus Andersenbacteria bacterium RIFCSPHIGHO2_12_FULL_46_9]|nr:MAG: hypothetical protein UW94_C0007G0034 [Parcubacteria group bacterium GW2011_GWA2_45_14]OGY33029.1 MAG: hypothetical protein A3B76_01290 [Candidatus Andersenbacteria bacterium RIFCSPHIGHO2_02_FULL_46_16]OGY36527.1 MAG: hypothetical protein A3E37_02795 [Candidatus Andersenbacteria bacterium RIFCSPHIGHO2_12_FULL_46_9]OGY37130.1 MAG: hypothetical protein A3I08_02090 [Candidatus Andersenbacteria bacterium RIFCSPLOWO2_02_FULL_46_11]OGY39494.1 MAG: hypothetical protein A3G57_04235 [Candidatus A